MVHARYRTLLAAGLTSALLSLTPDADAIRVRHDVPVEAYNELAAQPQFEAVGFVRAGNMGCSGTLVAPDKVLTAAHCLTYDNGTPLPAREVTFRVDRLDGSSKTYRARYVDVHPDWDRQRNKNTDIAVITLRDEVEGVQPLPVTTADPQERIGTMVGYGTQGHGNQASDVTYLPGATERLAAQNVIDRLRPECCNSGNWMIHIDFDNPDRRRDSSLGDRDPLPLEGGLSFGDSGSPLFARFGNRDFVVGVASYIYGMGKPGPTGYGERAGYQWTGSGEVELWLDLVGVDLVHDPFSAQFDIAADLPEHVEGMDTVPADMTGDGVVTPRDAAMLAQYFATGDMRGDVNGDGRVDIRDAAHMLEALGYRHSSYPRKRQWKRAVRDMFRNDVTPHLVGYSKRDRKQMERLFKKAHKYVTG